MTSRHRQWIVAGLCGVALMASAYVALERSRLPNEVSDPVFEVRAVEGPTAESGPGSSSDAGAGPGSSSSPQGPVTLPIGPTPSTDAPADVVRAPAPRPAPRPTTAPTTATTTTTAPPTSATTAPDPTEPTPTTPTSNTTATTSGGDPDPTDPTTTTATTPSITRPTVIIPPEPTVPDENSDDD